MITDPGFPLALQNHIARLIDPQLDRVAEDVALDPVGWMTVNLLFSGDPGISDQ